VNAVRARRRLVTGVVLAALAGSIAWLGVRTPEYTATAQILIAPLPNIDDTFLGLPLLRDSGDPTRTVETAAALVDTPRSAREAARRLGAPWTARLVMDAVDVQPEGQSNILDVTARASSPRFAVELADTFTRAALDLRDARARVAVARTLAQLDAAHRRVGSSTELENRISALEQVSVSGDPTTSFSRAAVAPRSPAGAPPWMIVGLALVAGALLGSAAALVADGITPSRIRGEDDLADIHPLPVLARVPALGRVRASGRPTARRARVRSAFRNLRLQVALQSGDHRCILVTSPSQGDGRTACVVDLAVELASTGEPVIVVDLDIARPEVARALGIAPSTDFRALLAPDGRLADALTAVEDVPGLSVVAGTAEADPATLEALRYQLPAVLDEALGAASYVLIDTAPLAWAGDVLPLLPAVDDVILVARLGHTTVAEVADAGDLLERMDIHPTGYVVVGGVAGSIGGNHHPLVARRRVQAPAS
jgi:Mrp family chromosome partitioning ATPase/capsular polysaccharide biosynthesis protein